MAPQETLFDLGIKSRGPRQPHAASRAGDPESSRIAAEAVQPHLGDQMTEVLKLVKRWQGRTSKELAVLSGEDRHMLAKRLPDLRTAGMVQCTADSTGRRQLRWWPAPGA